MKYSTIEKTRLSTMTESDYTSRKSAKSRFRKLRRIVKILFWIGVFWFLNHGEPFIIKDVRISASDTQFIKKNFTTYQTSDLKGMNVFYCLLWNAPGYIISDPLIESVDYSYNLSRELTIKIDYATPVASMAKPGGFYILGENGQYIGTLPVYAGVYLPVKFTNEDILFHLDGSPRDNPWQENLADRNLDDYTLMTTLGYRDLMRLRELITDQEGFPEVQYIGYDDHYGLVLKCAHKPLILLGYGNNLFLQFEKARKVLINPEINFTEDRYIDLRFDRFQSVKNMDDLDGLFS